MAKIVENEKDFKIIKLNINEAIELCNFGNICDFCNNEITFYENCYFVAVLNMLLCETCYKEWYQNAIRYKEDYTYEKRIFNRYCRLLNITE